MAGSEDEGAVAIDFSLQLRLPDRLLNDIDPTSEKVGQAKLQVLKPSEIVKAAFREIIRQAHGHVNV